MTSAPKAPAAHTPNEPPPATHSNAPTRKLLHSQSLLHSETCVEHADFTHPRQTPTLVPPSSAASGGFILLMSASIVHTWLSAVAVSDPVSDGGTDRSSDAASWPASAPGP